MNISDRYRDLVADVRFLREKLEGELSEEGAKVVRQVVKAYDILLEMQESVGEIPRMKLEDKLSPILLKAHSCLDRARLEVEALEEKKQSERIWEVEQAIYRLLNSL